MDTLAGAAMPSDLTGRSFALLNEAERERLATLLRPLAWIDGLIAAEAIAPATPMDAPSSPDELELDEVESALDWLDLIWNEEKQDEVDKLTPRQSIEVVTPTMDHYCHVANALCDEAEPYRPYLAGYSDPLEAASQWAAGFCAGLSLNIDAWARLLADDDARPLLVAIFALVHEKDMPEDARGDSPFRQVPPERLDHMRRSAVEMLPEIVLSLHDHALGLDPDLDLDEDDDLDEAEGEPEGPPERPQDPYVRAMPKVGRNDPCPCGSGKKHKKCCLQ